MQRKATTRRRRNSASVGIQRPDIHMQAFRVAGEDPVRELTEQTPDTTESHAWQLISVLAETELLCMSRRHTRVRKRG